MAVLLAGTALSGCASTNNADSLAQNDPYEPTNRQMFAFNQALDKHVALPVAHVYNGIVPQEFRDSIHNLLVNLGKPVVFANDLLQGSPDRAFETASRFAVNSTFGAAGIVDMATKWGMPEHSEDFGQTLGVWGVGEGPYLVLPGLGPKPPRDLAGDVADNFLDPLTYARFDGYWTFTYTRAIVGVVDLRARHIEDLEAIERSSVDYYATQRSLYRQFRNSEIRNGVPDNSDLPDL
ncbi:MAG TPA: VacJ family lipoprotein [Rhizomicrobium sp.]|nr:VacJ family lipoprotein [Rhizomicrobium sp.]